MSGYRTDRVSEDIRREVISIMRELKDPRVYGKLLTVIRVDVSSDLSYAKVYVSSLQGIEDAKQAVVGLKSAKGFIKTKVGKALHLRKTPELTFIADDSVEHGMDIDKLIKKANDKN